jgi:uncharacterized protein (TIRG00374 family)
MMLFGEKRARHRGRDARVGRSKVTPAGANARENAMVGEETGLAAQNDDGRSSSREGAARSERTRGSTLKRVLGGVFSIALIVFIFLGVIPQFASYDVAWEAISQMSTAWWLALIVGAVFYDVSFAWPYQAALPGLRYRHGYMETQTSSAISNTVPAGGAVAIGMTFRMFESVDQSDVAISTAVVATGMWNMAFKFGLPIVAVTLVLLTGQNTAGTLALAALGVVIIVVAGIVVWLALRDDRSAQFVGRLGDRVVNWCLHIFRREPSDRLERAVVRFREQTSEIVHGRAGRLTVSVLASQLAVFVLLLLSARAVGIPGDQVSFLEMLLSFSVARLIGAIPITPGGLGIVDAALIAMLTGFGASSDAALAADLVWRATTYFPPIFLGVGTYAVWRRGMTRGRYQAGPV